jgi:flavin-dependent dehydrogenase
VPEPAGLDVGDMVVVGPNGRRVVLPCVDGLSYPGRARAVTRVEFDDALRAAALDAGAVEVSGRADRPLWSGDQLDGFTVDSHELHADFIIGADGATSHVAHSAGLVDSARVLWGFAVRCYLDQPVALPAITLWEPTPWHAFPGYGWIFPGPAGVANVGLGLGTLSDRQSGAGAVRLLPAYLDHLVSLGLLDRAPALPLARRLGGWLKMGMVGTTPAAGRVLLVGDAAGLVNPLQGEGIAQAMTSGRAAAEAVIGSPGRAAPRYRHHLAGAHLPYQRVAAAGHVALVSKPRAVAIVGAGAHRSRGGPGPGRRVGHLLERAARRRRPRTGPDGGGGIDPGGQGDHRRNRCVPLVHHRLRRRLMIGGGNRCPRTRNGGMVGPSTV